MASLCRCGCLWPRARWCPAPVLPQQLRGPRLTALGGVQRSHISPPAGTCASTAESSWLWGPELGDRRRAGTSDEPRQGTGEASSMRQAAVNARWPGLTQGHGPGQDLRGLGASPALS